MANCRCADKDMYTRDLDRIALAKSYAGKIVTASCNIDEALMGQKSRYTVTVKSTDDFAGEFDNVNKDGTSTARDISVYLGWVERTVKEYLRMAIEEDNQHHEEERLKQQSDD